MILDDGNVKLTSDYSRILARIVLNPHNLQVTLNFVKNSDSSIVLLYFGSKAEILFFRIFKLCEFLFTSALMTSQSAVLIKLSALRNTRNSQNSKLKSAKVAKLAKKFFSLKNEN